MLQMWSAENISPGQGTRGMPTKQAWPAQCTAAGSTAFPGYHACSQGPYKASLSLTNVRIYGLAPRFSVLGIRSLP